MLKRLLRQVPSEDDVFADISFTEQAEDVTEPVENPESSTNEDEQSKKPD